MSTLFRETTTEQPRVDEPLREGKRTEEDVGDFKPIEDEQDILDALGVEEEIKALPEEDYKDLHELKDYLSSYMQEQGLPQTVRGVRKALEGLKEDAGLHKEADPQTVIKRIGSIARSWKELSFVQDVDERKKILIKLMGASSPKEMDRLVMEAMEERKVWRQ